MKRLILASALAVLIGVPSGWVIAMLLTPALWRLEPILHFGAWSRSCIWNWPVTPVRLIGFFTCVVDRDPFVIRHLLGLAPPESQGTVSRLILRNSRVFEQGAPPPRSEANNDSGTELRR